MPRTKSVISQVDGSNLSQMQGGWIDPPPLKEEKPVEELSNTETIEKKLYMRIIKQLVPEFPIAKLEKQSYDEVSKYFDSEVSPLVQEEIKKKYKEFSP